MGKCPFSVVWHREPNSSAPQGALHVVLWHHWPQPLCAPTQDTDTCRCSIRTETYSPQPDFLYTLWSWMPNKKSPTLGPPFYSHVLKFYLSFWLHSFSSWLTYYFNSNQSRIATFLSSVYRFWFAAECWLYWEVGTHAHTLGLPRLYNTPCIYDTSLLQIGLIRTSSTHYIPTSVCIRMKLFKLLVPYF